MCIRDRIKCIEVLTVQVILHNSETFTKSLKVYDFSFTQEFDCGINIRVIFHKPEDIVIGSAGLLFWHDLVSTTYTKI